MKEAGSAEQFRLLQQKIVLAGEAVEKLKRDQQLSGAKSAHRRFVHSTVQTR